MLHPEKALVVEYNDAGLVDANAQGSSTRQTRQSTHRVAQACDLQLVLGTGLQVCS